jgi:hypothetical protein
VFAPRLLISKGVHAKQNRHSISLASPIRRLPREGILESNECSLSPSTEDEMLVIENESSQVSDNAELKSIGAIGVEASGAKVVGLLEAAANSSPTAKVMSS